MFARLGPWCHDHRRAVVIARLVLPVGGFGISGAVGSDFRDEFNLHDTESRTGLDTLEDRFGGEGSELPGHRRPAD